MTQVDAQRARYLEALGIDLWVRRGQPAGATASAPAAVLRAPEAPTAPAVARVEPAPPAPAPAGPVATDWDGLRQQVLACTRCALHQGRTQAVFASGDRQARWMVIGEAPGADEDRQGEPFVGRAGQLLNAMLAAIGLPRPTVFVANMLKCRPPQNRDPLPDEVASCSPFLHRQLRAIEPKVIMTLGRFAATTVVGVEGNMGELRKRTGSWNGVPIISTYHPSYLLRTPHMKRAAWEDLLRVRGLLRAPS